jgi:hypothetical protein
MDADRKNSMGKLTNCRKVEGGSATMRKWGQRYIGELRNKQGRINTSANARIYSKDFGDQFWGLADSVKRLDFARAFEEHADAVIAHRQDSQSMSLLRWKLFLNEENLSMFACLESSLLRPLFNLNTVAALM